MTPPFLVVATGASASHRFHQRSALEALNTKAFLEMTGEYEDVSVFRLSDGDEWVALEERL